MNPVVGFRGLHEKFEMDADPANAGVGRSLDQVMALKPTLENLNGYAEAVRKRTVAYLPSLDSVDLKAEDPTPLGDNQKLGGYLGGFLLDHLSHSGQLGYIRGCSTGFGWFPI